MTAAERKALGKYVRWVGDAIGLRDWWFDIMHDEPENAGDMACCDPFYGQRQAKLWFRNDLRTLEPVQQRAVVVHELLHCHFAATQEQVRLDLLKHLGQAAYDLFLGSWRMNHEYALDATARALAKHMPDIAWPKAKP